MSVVRRAIQLSGLSGWSAALVSLASKSNKKKKNRIEIAKDVSLWRK